jgi:Flp pilus assembly protein TadD
VGARFCGGRFACDQRCGLCEQQGSRTRFPVGARILRAYSDRAEPQVKYYPSDEPLKIGLEHFDRGNYGTAERYFRDAVEKAPRDATAWVGLAAAYDRLARFDLADRAYHTAVGLTGETTQILNNEGYSFMLRGDLPKARSKLLKAYEREPSNPLIINNLKLLDSSQRLIRRAPDPRGVAPD